jgi:hypothetical protein
MLLAVLVVLVDFLIFYSPCCFIQYSAHDDK